MHNISRSKRKSEKALYTNCCCFSRKERERAAENVPLSGINISIIEPSVISVLPCVASHHKPSRASDKSPVIVNKFPRHIFLLSIFQKKYSFVVVTDGEENLPSCKYLLLQTSLFSQEAPKEDFQSKLIRGERKPTVRRKTTKLPTLK